MSGLEIAYGLYAGFATLALIFVITILPQTGGRQLS